MAPGRGARGAEVHTMRGITGLLTSGTATQRGQALDRLIDYFNNDRGSQDSLDDKSYHGIYEALFRCTLLEKENFFSNKKTTKSTAAARLKKCAEALRLAVGHGASRIKRKTARAIIDHITEVLPGPEEDYFEPLLQDYLKALAGLLEIPAVVENLAATSQGEGWEVCASFCIEALTRYLAADGGSGSVSRASPGPGTGQAFSSGRSGPLSLQRTSGQLGNSMATDLVSCLGLLVSSPNAPIQERAKKISTILIQLLQIRQNMTTLQKTAFSGVNHIFMQIQASDVSLARSLARDLVPLIAYWWQSRGSSRDASRGSLRDEVIKVMYMIHPHLESLLRDSPEESSLIREARDLLDTLWSEYSRRDDRLRLQLDDVTFTSMNLPLDHPATTAFKLRPYHTSAEHNWALLENMALLEAVWLQNSSRDHAQSNPSDDDQPRKKRRVTVDSNRVYDKISSPDPGVSLTALQLIPFVFSGAMHCSLSDASETIDYLTSSITSKQNTVASWAMLACASLAVTEHARDKSLLASWKQIWQLGVRSVSLPGTSRAACSLLRSILRADIIPNHELADDINQIVTTADISGPSVLVDSSLALMLDLLRLRNVLFPNASQATRHHIIRWVFVKWNPAELAYASLHAKHATPFELEILLRSCFGDSVPPRASPVQVFSGPVMQFRKRQRDVQYMTRYLLLLEGSGPNITASQKTSTQGADAEQLLDPAGSEAAKRLTLELFYPKLEDLTQMTESWQSQKRGGEGTIPVSSERLCSLISACVLGTLLLPELNKLNSSPSRDLETTVFSLLETALKAMLDSTQSVTYTNLLLTSVAPYIPPLSETTSASLKVEKRELLLLFSRSSTALQEKMHRETPIQDPESMDLDDDFSPQVQSQSNTTSKAQGLPRRDVYLACTPDAFYLETTLRLHFLGAIFEDNSSKAGLVPESVVDQLVGLSDEQLLCSRSFMKEIFASELDTRADDAMRIVEAAGTLISSAEFSCCEAALCTCIDVLESFISMWTNENLEVSSMAGDLYYYLVKTALPSKAMSPAAEVWLSRLLFRLLEVKPTYADSLELPSSRTTLLTILKNGSAETKYYIGATIPKVFSLYVLKVHDDIFVDVLESLPSDMRKIEGIAFRLFVLAELACHWSTLLRRCVYHIFETPGRVANSGEYAAVCLRKVSKSLKLDTPRELFRLFAPQLLYTWLDSDSIEDIPYQVFGFTSLQDLFTLAQTEAAAIMLMRGQEEAVHGLAKTLGMTAVDVIKQSFTKIAAYCMAHDLSAPKSEGHVTGEARLRKLLGKELFLESLHLNFADIIAVFFEVFDQEDSIEKAFRRDERFSSAVDVMEEIKAFGYLNTELPPNQQPTFRAKYLPRQLDHLCSWTAYELETLWTPALVVSIARKLLNKVHPVLGPLHACSILRKMRYLICMAGPEALSFYPLEMLLHSIRAFIVNPECADDAFGMSQYLLEKGALHLQRAPSFLAGYALSTLADLRVFLESSQSSTTQESQFKATKNKAQLFHSWFSQYLVKYDSSEFTDKVQKEAFKSITASAAHIQAWGNAEKGTHESNLLLEILNDWERDQAHQLLNEPARQVALALLCGDFRVPLSSRLDVVETDEDALGHGTAIWKSCGSEKLSKEYLAWAGRVVGRSFAASGEIPPDLLRESSLEEYRKFTPEHSGSEGALLNLIQTLTVSTDCHTAGLAESALRTVVSDALAADDAGMLSACSKSLSESLQSSSNWAPYQTPPSDYSEVKTSEGGDIFAAEQLESQDWVQRLSAFLAQAVPDNVALSVLPPILCNVKGFAEQAFPFIVHLVLLHQLDRQQGIKRQISEALKEWLKSTSLAAQDNLKLLINTILYLRTQPLPNESSIADRSHWLDINFPVAAAAATRCAMYKVALLFAELAASEPSRQSRRSSALREADDSSEALLEIFESIDDPDAYYGLNQDASLATVLARLEYEKDGTKSLAFRGAQYDSHLRQRNAASGQDAQALVNALNSLGLSGLSNSLLQARQGVAEVSSSSLDSTFTTARKLEVWNLPAPSNAGSSAVTMYKAYQCMQKTHEISVVRSAIHDGLANTTKHLASREFNASSLRQHLGALASLTELDDLLHVADQQDHLNVLARFESRAKWMMSGRYTDVSQILSCRETTLSMLSQHKQLRTAKLSPSDARLVQIRGLLLSSQIYRFHRATQETLNLSTALTDLIGPSNAEGLVVDAAVRIEAANSLWDHGEMIPSIRMLQSIDKDSSLKKQSVPVSRSDLLSKIGHQVSMARLESPDNIQKKYLEPALKELKGNMVGKEASQVFHQFAMFCDEQLQNQGGLEDLARLQSLKKGKSDEVAQLKALIASARDSQQKNRFSSHLAKAKQWLELDQQELRRVEQTRNEFVKLSLENYLLALTASDDHNNDALRFTALWLEHADEDTTNDAVRRYLDKVPTRKFASLMNQLSSRLQDKATPFQKLLGNLVYHICINHPYHSMYQIWSNAKTRANKDDEVAISRQKRTEGIAKMLSKSQEPASSIWPAIDMTSRAYHTLAMDRDPNRYRAGQKIAIKDSQAGQSFLKELARHPIPPPTMQIELSASMDYSDVPMIHKFEPQMSIASGVSAPKIITAIATDGKRYKQLVKGGNDDLRQDAIMEQVFAAVSGLLKLHRTTRQRNLGIRTYKVLPLTSSSGLIEFVSDTIPLHEYLMPAHERYYPKDLKGSQCRKEISNAQTKTAEVRIATYRKVTERFHPVMRYFFMENFADPDEWFTRRTAYTRTTAAVSMLGHVLGLGDRHGHNILLDGKTGEVVHIDLGVAFEMGRVLPVPELVPFRLTRDIVDGMGITKTEGVFRRCCEFTLDALREETYSIMTILDVLRYDPLYSWSISPVRLAKLQNASRGGGADAAATGSDNNNNKDNNGSEVEDNRAEGAGGGGGGGAVQHGKKMVNEPSEADRALEVVRKKLSKTLSVTATVNDLINQATDERNLAVLYSGWAAYA